MNNKKTIPIVSSNVTNPAPVTGTGKKPKPMKAGNTLFTKITPVKTSNNLFTKVDPV